MNPVVEGALISGGVAIALQLINWGREATASQRAAAQAREAINEQRVDELRVVLEEAARALRHSHELLRGATGLGPRDAADARDVEYADALKQVGDVHTRLAVRLGQNDPLVRAYRNGHGALDSLLPTIEKMRGPHDGVSLDEAAKHSIQDANRVAAASLMQFEHLAASVIGPELTVRVPRGDDPDP
jgi:hypothetical protein